MYEAVVPGPGAGGGEAAQVLCRILGLVRPGDLVLLEVSNCDIDVQHYTRYLEEGGGTFSLLEMSTKGFVDNKSKESKCSGG